MKTRFRRSRLSPQEKTALGLVLAASLLVWGVLALSLVGIPGGVSKAQGVAPPLSIYLSTPALSATPSPTSTSFPQPTDAGAMQPTPTATSTSAPTATPQSNPSTTDGDDTLVIALLGMDNPRRSKLWRTDSIMLVFIDEERQRIGILSIPRDLWVSIPGHGHNRINTVDSLGERTRYPGGGPALLDQTLRRNLDISIDHYVRVDFGGFVRIVDEVGGITVDVEKPLRDRFPDPLSPSGYTRITLHVVSRHMDGHMALSYCRSRISTNDFDRSHRQQQVIMALWKKMLTPETLIRAPKLWDEFNDAFDTDMTMFEALQLAYVVHSIGSENVRTKSLGYDAARPWRTPGGAQVLIPRTSAIQQTIRDLLSPSD